jgi:aminopeptidase N
MLNFDGISYAKGAATLRQLVAWLGEETFMAGVRTHFAAHAFGNATLADLLVSLESASGRDLADWARRWWRESGINTLAPRWEAGGSAVVVEQAGAVLRPHRINIGWYGPDGHATGRVPVDLDATVHSGPVSVPAGVSADDLLLVNDGDLTYTKVRLADWAPLPGLLPRVGDSLTRAVFWGAAWEAVRDAVLPPGYFVRLLVAALPAEVQVTMFEDLLGYAGEALIPRYLPAGDQAAASEPLAAICAKIARVGDGRQLGAVRGWVSFTADGPALRRALAGSGLPRGVTLDNELRWAVLRRLAVLGELGAAEIDEEYAQDRTATGAEHAAWCRAASPDPAAKERAWAAVRDDQGLSNRLLFVTADGFWQPGQESVLAGYVDRYASDLSTLARHRPALVAGRLATLMYPRFMVRPATLEMSERVLATGDLTSTVRRSVVDATDELRRSLKAQALAREAGQEAPR